MTERLHLSPTLYRLAEIIGLPLALRLTETFGGGEIYVPARPSATHPIVRCIGLDAALALALAFGVNQAGARIDVPKADSVNRNRRNRAIVEAVEAGVSKQVVARQHGLTTRWVRQLCNDDDDSQPDLFDSPGR